MDNVPSGQEPHSVNKNASWGAIISILVIMAMVVIGAFYAWGKRIDEEHSAAQAAQTASTTVNQ
jgi:predicted permease